MTKKALINRKECVACGACAKTCPKKAIEIFKGMYAKVEINKCVGCSMCEKICPASVIRLEAQESI